MTSFPFSLFSFSDVNECHSDPESYPCANKATCNNTIGNYTCQCDTGYFGDGKVCEGEYKTFIDHIHTRKLSFSTFFLKIMTLQPNHFIMFHISFPTNTYSLIKDASNARSLFYISLKFIRIFCAEYFDYETKSYIMAKDNSIRIINHSTALPFMIFLSTTQCIDYETVAM